MAGADQKERPAKRQCPLPPEEVTPLASKTSVTRLNFTGLLTSFQVERCFPEWTQELPPAAMQHAAAPVGVAAHQFASCDWSGQTIKDHCVQLQEFLSDREVKETNLDALAVWLVRESSGPRSTLSVCGRRPGALPNTASRASGERAD